MRREQDRLSLPAQVVVCGTRQCDRAAAVRVGALADEGDQAIRLAAEGTQAGFSG